MFGESESESPPVPSPWDSLISFSSSPSPSPMPRTPPLIPSLVPENEEGNVEYKLQLLSPSEARFARLVTQMKWRLLEGGGQAYYELGVADSGALIGLPRAELEQSLETLEMMAGEIGASVIVVKEIEVPSSLAGLAGRDADRWNHNRRRKARRELTMATTRDVDVLLDLAETVHGKDDSQSDADTSEDLDESEWTEPPLDESDCSSPTIFAFDSLASQGDDEGLADISLLNLDRTLQHPFDLQISSVYKPRPFRTRRSSSTSPLGGDGGGKGRRQKKRYDKLEKQLLARNTNNGPAAAQDAALLANEGKNGRRSARERRRDEKRKALLTYAEGPSACTVATPGAEQTTLALDAMPATSPLAVAGGNPEAPIEVTDELVAGLESLHVSVDTESIFITANDADADDADVFPAPKPFTSALSSASANRSSATDAEPSALSSIHGPRLIVEALVVRKLSLEEAFLDFGGFSLM